ncbi:MAG: hypothetical protein ABI277_17595 [Burkholderiaceae bacterium]
MSTIRIRPTQLAILISLFGVVLPGSRIAYAQGSGSANAAVIEPAAFRDTAIRDVLGLQDVSGRSDRIVAPTAPLAAQRDMQSDRAEKQPKRRVAAGASASPRWDATTLGLGRAEAAAAPDERRRSSGPDEVAVADIDRMRSILGLDREPMTTALLAPLKNSLRRPARESRPTQDMRDAATATASPGRDAPVATPLPTAEAGDVAMASDPVVTDDFVSPIAEVHKTEPGAESDVVGLLRSDTPPPTRQRRDRNPALAMMEATILVRRGNVVTTASLALPPEEVESLDETLRIRLRGQFRLIERDDPTLMPDASSNDPLLALLQVLSDRDQDRGLPAPIIYLATAPEDPRAAVISAGVFRHLTESVEQWFSGNPVAVAAAVPAPEPPVVIALTPAAPTMPAAAQAAIEPVSALTFARLDPASPPSVESTLPRAPLLPRNPFAWHGDDAIDLSASLVDHPLLVAAPVPTEPLADPLHMVIALREAAAAAPFAQHAMTDVVDVFDPDLALARNDDAGPQQAGGPSKVPDTKSAPAQQVGPIDHGPNSIVVAAMDRHALATPKTPVASGATTAIPPASPEIREIVQVIEPNTVPPSPAVIFEADENRLSGLQGSRVALADSRLAEMRGGFETDAGLKISFGIERAVYINGSLVTSTSLNVADLSKLTAGQVQTMGLDRSTLGIIQSGPNNTFSPGQLSSSSVATVIQNTLNDQKIQGITQINATVNSLDLIRKSSIQQNIQSALADSIRH